MVYGSLNTLFVSNNAEPFGFVKRIQSVCFGLMVCFPG